MDKQIDFESIIYRGIESDELDYKSAQNWNDLSRAGKSKFVRHSLAMANTKGGYIVVGVGENEAGKPCLYTGLTEKEAKSFDPTSVGNFINRYADPEIEFTLEKPEVDGKQYVIFVIKRFSKLPHVCGYGLGDELNQGVFYIRTADASSRAAYRASEMHSIIQRSLRNQREDLGRMLRGILYENKNGIEQDDKTYFKEQVDNARSATNKILKIDNQTEKVFLEVSVYPSTFIQDEFGLSDLKMAVRNISRTIIDSPFISNDEIEESFFSNTYLRFASEKQLRFWQIFRSGLFVFNSSIGNDKTIEYKEIIKLISRIVCFIGDLYSELDYENEILNLKFKLKNVENAQIINKEEFSSKYKKEYKCKIPEISIKLQRDITDLAVAGDEHATVIIKEICERFNLSATHHNNLEERIKKLIG